MASVDITELIPNLESAITIPGTTSPYAAATDEEWTLKLVNGFWQAVLEGVIEGYQVDEDGLISPISGDDNDTFSREYQQIVVIYAAMNTINARLLNLPTNSRAQAGPVEYETNQAASVLTALLGELQNQKNIILQRISDLGSNTSTFYYDSPIQRRENQTTGDAYWIGF